MDLFKSMKAFVVTVDAGSMSSAAMELKLTPAMVGQHIAALETKLGTQLLNRTTRRQSLTDFGKTYIEQCRDILERVALTEIEAEAQSNEAQGLLRITAPVTFGTAVLIPVFKKYRERSPNVKLDLLLTDNSLDIVEEGIDIAFRIGDIPDSRIIQRILMPYKMIVCASPEYLANSESLKHPADLTAHEVVSFTKTADRPLKFYNNEHCIEVKPRSMVSVNSGYALLSAAKSGLGVIVQPEILLEDDLKEGKLVRVLSDWHLGERQVSMIYYRDKKMTPKVRGFIDFSLMEFRERYREQ
ncbi:LysR family transcriptional regulator [Vibrio mimicus]|uniref:LysR family transcriptional regulator n=1 Tax=Vibrio mimicus TaxID=674 RepID=UPI002F948556